MTGRGKFAFLVAVIFAGGIAVPVATGVAVVAALAPPDQQVVLRVLGERLPLLVFGALALLALCLVLVRWLHAVYIVPARALAEQTRIVASVDDGMRVSSEGAAELAQLADMIQRLAEDRRRLRRDFDARARESQMRLAEERNRLAALMSELAEGVLVCNAEGRILLYNEQARALFAHREGSGHAVPVGLGRSIFSLIDRDQVAHTLDKLGQGLARGDAAPGTRFVAPTGTGRLVRYNAAPYLGSDGAIAGIVFTLSDVTGLLEREAQRLSLLHAIATRARAPVANIRAAAENLVRFSDMDCARRQQFIEIVAAESQGLSRSIHDALHAYGDALKASLTLEDMRAVDLLNVAQRLLSAASGIEVDLDAIDDSVWLSVDSFALVQALAFLAAKLKDDYKVRSVRLSARSRGRFAELDMAWRGAVLANDALRLWEDEPMNAGAQHTPLTLRDVLERHGGEAWLHAEGAAGQRAYCVRLLLPAGAASDAGARPTVAVESRPEYYDFDLFARGAPSQDLRANSLAQLTYTVFDTETTGLEPSAGDEIISIGAVRIVNGRLLKSETYERLVDPRRPLNQASARIHGIDAGALAGQPNIEEVLPAFRRFCEDTILVAHNAAFDMRFLELKEASAGVRFEQPVLDTLLLSAVVHPNFDDHRLEAIAVRLGVPVVGRHTALGDALLAAEVFLRLLQLLSERGIATLGEALDASRETYYARLRY